MEIIIDNFDFYNMEAMSYYSFSSSFKGDKSEKAKELCLSNRYLGARKMDGVWAMFIKDNQGKCHLRSRKAGVNGSFVDKAEWVPHICKDLDDVPNGTVFIGEIYFPNNEGSRKITSVLNCLKEKCIERQREGSWLHYYIFDVVAYRGKSLINTPFETRIDHFLHYELCDVLKHLDYVEVANYLEGQELWNSLSEILLTGGEGIVITRKDCKYLCSKRTAWMTLKMKKELTDTIDAFLDGNYKPANKTYTGDEIEKWAYWINEKTGEHYDKPMYRDFIQGMPIVPVKKPYFYGWASSVSLSVMKDGEPYFIGWISNIPDKVKEGIVKEPEKWVGRVVELNAMMLEHINEHYSFRHCKIEKWRDDKKMEDCLFSQIVS